MCIFTECTPPPYVSTFSSFSTGVGIAGIGLLIETLADEQKVAAKREAPRLPVMDGLFSLSAMLFVQKGSRKHAKHC